MLHLTSILCEGSVKIIGKDVNILTRWFFYKKKKKKVNFASAAHIILSFMG